MNLPKEAQFDESYKEGPQENTEVDRSPVFAERCQPVDFEDVSDNEHEHFQGVKGTHYHHENPIAFDPRYVEFSQLVNYIGREE